MRLSKIISLLITVAIILNLIALSSFSVIAADMDDASTAMIDEAFPDYEYMLLADETVEISKYTGEGGNLVIPSLLDNHPVTRIGSRAFRECNTITGIVIPDTVTSIGKSAFWLCYHLSSVVFSESLTVIDDSAFVACGLKEISLPDTVTSIGSDSFQACSNLEKVMFGNSITTVSDSAFLDCYKLKSITIPASVTTIGTHAFGYFQAPLHGADILTYKKIENFTVLGYNNTNAEAYATENDFDFVSLSEIPDSEKFEYSIFDNNTARIDRYIGNDTEIVIPSNIDGHKVTALNNYLFNNCLDLTSVTIPSSVISIGYGLFPNCPSLSRVVVVPENPVYDSRNNCNAIIETASNTLTSGCKSTIIPDTVTKLGGYAFHSCSGLKSITIPDSVTDMGPGFTFAYCKDLENVTLSDSITEISYAAFEHCTALKSIPRNDTITSIGLFAFCGCTELKSIIIPETVTSIGDAAFLNCTNLSEIIFPNNIIFFAGGNGVFDGTEWYNNQPDGVVYAGKMLYKVKGNCPSEVIIIDGTVGIGFSAFSNCKDLESVVIPNSVKSIHPGAFMGCTGLSSVIIPKSVTDIDEYAFGYLAWNGVAYDFTICGYKETSAESYASNNHIRFVVLEDKIILGDTDGDNEITALDLTCIQRMLAHLVVSRINELAADIDGDNQITALDATFIQRHLAHMQTPYSIGEEM